MILENITSSGKLTVLSSKGHIKENGVLDIKKGASFTASFSDKTIVLENARNSIAGSVKFNTTGEDGDISFYNSVKDTKLDTSNIGGDMHV